MVSGFFSDRINPTGYNKVDHTKKYKFWWISVPVICKSEFFSEIVKFRELSTELLLNQQHLFTISAPKFAADE